MRWGRGCDVSSIRSSSVDPTPFIKPGETIKIGFTIAVVSSKPNAVTPTAILLKVACPFIERPRLYFASLLLC
jgi:hypothetical protein